MTSDALTISFSSIGLLKSCPRKFQIYKDYDAPEYIGDSLAMDTGTALHVGYQSYLIHGNRDLALWDYMKAYPLHLCTDPLDDRSLEAGAATLEAMIDSDVLSNFELAHLECIDGVTRPAIEVPFEIEIANFRLPDGRRLVYNGKIDAIVFRHWPTGVYQTLDIKTNRSQRKDRTPEFKFNSQQVPYGIIVEHIVGHVIDTFEVIYFDCFVDLLDPRISIFQYEKTRKDIDRWILSIAFIAREIQDYYYTGVFPRTYASCFDRYNRACGFLDGCDFEDGDALQKWLMPPGAVAAEPHIKEPWVKCELNLPEGWNKRLGI